MSRDIGPTQLAILGQLSGSEEALTIRALAEALDLTERRVRAAVDALEERERVVTTKGAIGVSSRDTPVIGILVWLPEAYTAHWRSEDREHWQREWEAREVAYCGACGQPMTAGLLADLCRRPPSDSESVAR